MKPAAPALLPARAWRRALAGLAVAGLAAAPARAQDYMAEPTHGTFYLDAGFYPQTQDVTAGGDVSPSVGGCTRGWVADAPSVRVSYTRGGRGHDDFYVHASSSTDTVLLVRTPDGSWRCDDDGLGGLNPLVAFLDAQAGTYVVWVGTYSAGSASATLQVTPTNPR